MTNDWLLHSNYEHNSNNEQNSPDGLWDSNLVQIEKAVQKRRETMEYPLDLDPSEKPEKLSYICLK